ncbi:nitroreductase family protein [bacterium]|nr:nitroreductase family protein [bacterium]
MTVREAIMSRYSVRAYKSEPIEDEKLELVLDAARLAPSASNAQEWKFIVVKEPQLRESMIEAAHDQVFVGEAPVIIVGVSLDPEHLMRCGVSAGVVDLTIAIDHITLQAAELGLGTCWIGSFYQDKVKRLLNIPDEYKVISLTPLGYPADKPKPKSRKKLDEIIVYNRFK